jgi:hypothetical protein
MVAPAAPDAADAADASAELLSHDADAAVASDALASEPPGDDAADASDALASAADPGAAPALPAAVPAGGGDAGAIDDGVRRARHGGAHGDRGARLALRTETARRPQPERAEDLAASRQPHAGPSRAPQKQTAGRSRNTG